MNRETHRALKRHAAAVAVKMAKSCLGYHGQQLVQVVVPEAVAALRRALLRMLEAEARPCPSGVKGGRQKAFGAMLQTKWVAKYSGLQWA